MIIAKIKRYLKSIRRHISHQFFDEALLKKKGLEARAKEIEILAIGASHCTRGFDPNILKNAYNFGIMDEDLFTTHFLFNKYIDSLKNLKHLILFHSIPLEGYELAKTRSFKTMAIHHYLFDVPYPVKEILKWKRTIRHRFKTFNDTNIDYHNFTGYILDTRKVMAPTAEFRLFYHLRENKRPIKQNHHIFEIAKECQKRKIHFTLVMAPMRSDFIAELKKSGLSDNDLFPEVLKWCKENKISFLKELRSPDYDWDDFMDSDHLNQNGAVKLTRKIAKLINVKTK